MTAVHPSGTAWDPAVRIRQVALRKQEPGPGSPNGSLHSGGWRKRFFVDGRGIMSRFRPSHEGVNKSVRPETGKRIESVGAWRRFLEGVRIGCSRTV